MSKILLTSFQTWLPHQKSNSSDDLLAEIEHLKLSGLSFLRQLPVDIDQATEKAIAHIKQIQPDTVICCGMAESRDRLTIESNATLDKEKINTTVELKKLVAKLSTTAISHDAGKFVCEGLYYHLLKYLQQSQSQKHCIFVHVPVLTKEKFPDILTEFQLLLKEIHKINNYQI